MIFSVILTIETEDPLGHDHPARWDWEGLIGPEVLSVETFDVTRSPVERVRLTHEGATMIC